MDGHLVFRRTEKGDTEFRDREFGLAQKLRTVLILVDGSKNVADLHQYAEGIISDLDTKLEQLAIEGFIECDGLAWHKLHGHQVSDSGQADDDIEEIRSRLIDTAIMVLGKQSEPLVKKLDAADASLDSLNEAVAHCCKISSLIIDKAQCDELRQKLERVLATDAAHAEASAAQETEPGEPAAVNSVDDIRDRILGLLYEVLGEQAGKVSDKIVNADASIEALNEAVVKSIKSVQLFIDEKKASDLSRRCDEVLKAS